jgi:cellulose synthase/poly-beta-1,6-N-acetylglucosamine synthase-like glycosyltransferase
MPANGELPRVSVVVPVRDEAPRIARCLQALLAQTYPADRTEIIVVDNGSRDGTPYAACAHGVTVLSAGGTRSPYLARNKGIERARGEVLAFTDADCVPAKDWLERAVRVLLREEADLVGGAVHFAFSERPRAAEILDAVNNLDNERSIRDRGVAKTGNLVVRRRVFSEIGPFAVRRSGADVEFTARASGAGFALVFAPDAVVVKPARRLAALLRKQHRVGRGQYRLWRERGETRRRVLRGCLRALVPGRPSFLREPIRRRGPAGAEARLAGVWLVSWASAVSTAMGRLHELVAQGWRG